MEGGEPAVSDDGEVSAGSPVAVAGDALAVGAAGAVAGADPFGAEGAVGLGRPAHAEAGAACAAAIGREPADDEVSTARGSDAVDGLGGDVEEGTAVLAQEGGAVDVEDEVALAVAEGERTDEGGGVAGGQGDGAQSGDVCAAAVTGESSVEGLAVAGRADFHCLSSLSGLRGGAWSDADG